MNTPLDGAVQEFVKHFAKLLHENAELRNNIRTICTSILELTNQSSGQQDIDNAPVDYDISISAEVESHQDFSETIAALQSVLDQSSLTSGYQNSQSLVYSSDATGLSPHSDGTAHKLVHRIDDNKFLSEIRGVLQIKAQATRWAVERYSIYQQGGFRSDEIWSNDQEFFSRARARANSNTHTNCFLWMLSTYNPSANNLDEWSMLAECFECLMRAAEVLQNLLPVREGEQEFLEAGLDLAAEAQSALRIAVGQVDQGFDPSQRDFFNWLRTFAENHQIFLPQYMRLTDSADPQQYQNLLEQLDSLETKVEEDRQSRKSQRSLLSKARYHAKKITKGDRNLSEWESLARAMDELVSMGIRPSNREIREIILPIVDELPELVGEFPNFDFVLRETDRFLTTIPNESRAKTQREVSNDILEANRLLSGKSMVIIGGEQRGDSEQALKDAFGLKDLQWVSGAHHQSVEEFRPYIIRNDVLLVCLLIRWSSHSFGEIKNICDENDKFFVRIPGGFSPNQVAHQILVQVGNALEINFAESK